MAPSPAPDTRRILISLTKKSSQLFNSTAHSWFSTAHSWFAAMRICVIFVTVHIARFARPSRFAVTRPDTALWLARIAWTVLAQQRNYETRVTA
jgi:hypothetical protein